MKLTSCVLSLHRRPLLVAFALVARMAMALEIDEMVDPNITSSSLENLTSAISDWVEPLGDNNTSLLDADPADANSSSLENLTSAISDWAAQTSDGNVSSLENLTSAISEQRYYSTKLEDSDRSEGPVYVYAGAMFDLKARPGVDVEIDSLAFNTFLKSPLDVRLYIKDGSFRGPPETDLGEWTMVANLTVVGQGMGNPTYIPKGSFDPILIRRKRTMAFYLNTDRPNFRVSDGTEEEEGNPVFPEVPNQDLVMYQGLGKRNPMETAASYHRVFNGVIGYRVVDIPTLPPSASPTGAPTIDPEWEDAIEPANPSRRYFNYDPKSEYGPEWWDKVDSDGYYERFRGLRTNVRRNKCFDGGRQSPRNLCETRDKCIEFHETRLKAGEYGLGDPDKTRARPTPHIMHNKLRLAYKERRHEWERPAPPEADFARNGFNSGHQDLIHLDLKVRSEHRLCGKQYDGEMQLYYLHTYGNLEAISILIESDGERNEHFQKLLDYFQAKFDDDLGMCERKQRRARALFDSKKDGATTKRLRGATMEESTEVSDTVMTERIDENTALEGGISRRILKRFLSRRQNNAVMEVWDPVKPVDIMNSVHFWGYQGSTTEPPCFEQVKWRVMDVPMRISLGQYIQLKKLMFDHVDPDTCRKTSTHYDESNARPVQPHKGGATYRCRRSDYPSDMERRASGRRRGFPNKEDWRGVGLHPWVEGEFPNA